MKIEQAEKLVALLSGCWQASSFLNPVRITQELNRGICRSCSNFDTFEFSLVSFKESVRFLHLNFYKPNLSNEKIKVLRERRIESIGRIIKYANKEPGFKYNYEILRSVALVINDTLLPIQFGYESVRVNAPVIKIYISIMASNSAGPSFLRELCDLLDYKWEKLQSILSGSDIDAIGIDLLSDGSHRFKIYSYFRPPFNLSNIRKTYRKYRGDRDKYLDLYLEWIKNLPLRHLGFLYRINKVPFIDSVKIWARLEKPVPFEPLRAIIKPAPGKLNGWLTLAGDIIERTGASVSYLTLENKKLGVYFR